MRVVCEGRIQGEWAEFNSSKRKWEMEYQTTLRECERTKADVERRLEQVSSVSPVSLSVF